MQKRLRAAVVAGILTLFWSAALHSQAPTAQMTGIVTDASGAVVPGAKIDVIEIDTGLHSDAATNSAGNYVIANLKPGNYKIAVRKQGFTTQTRDDINLVVSQVARLDFTLGVGSTTETVEITGRAPVLETSTASIGQIIESKAVSDLPLNGRNFLQLSKLSAGVLESKPGDRASSGGSFIANGVRAQLNNFQLDGVDNNAKIVDQQNSSPVVIQPSVDAIQEFRVETNNYSAEYGYSAGAVVNATIKNGTNNFHGSAFEFLRNNYFDARNYFTTAGTRQPTLQQHQFGGTVGGPVIRNKAFFFGSWQRDSINRGITYVNTVATAAQKAGDFSGLSPIYDPATTATVRPGVFSRSLFPGNQIDSRRFSPAAAKLLAALPLPNFPNQTINNYVVSPTSTTRGNRFDFRHDLQISQQDNLFARYSYFQSDQVTPGPFPAPIIGSANFQIAPKANVGNGAALGETHIFSPTVVNEFRAGYNRIQDFLSPFVKDNVNDQFGLGGIPVQSGVTGLPKLSINGYADLGEATFLPNAKISETLTFEDHVSWTLGDHTLKLGGEYRWVRSWFDISSTARGSYTFSGAFTQNPQRTAGTGLGIADFLLGVPSSSSLSNQLSGDIRYGYYGGFVQDDWKVTPKLTLNLGVRYELWEQPVERHDQQANYLPNLQALVYPDGTNTAGVPASFVAARPSDLSNRSLMKIDKNNIAPRVGLAYQLTPTTVLRAGGGVFFADSPFVGASGRLVANPPFFRSLDFPTDQITPVLLLDSGFPTGALDRNINLTAAGLSSWAADLKQAYVNHWSFGIQKQVKNNVIEANYVGTSGSGLPLGYNINTPYAGPGSVASRRPVSALGNITFQSAMDSSHYDALELRFERRYSAGFGLLSAYTFSKTVDFGGEQLIGDLSLRDARNVKAEHGLSSGNTRHRWVSSGLFDIPVGRGKRIDIQNPFLAAVIGNWQLNAIFTIRSGQPFTPSLGTSTANTGAPRPDRIADGNLPGDQRTVNAWFDKTAFAAPTPYNFGNAGRNILIGPGSINLDASIFKAFPIRWINERSELQFRAEAFNFLNHPQFGQPNGRVDIPQGGTITSLSNDMREVQFALKFLF